MQFLRRVLDAQAKHFKPGGKLQSLHAVFDAGDTILFTPGEVTKGGAHVRDGLDLKRMMITVVVALLPCMYMAMYNTGLQIHLAMGQGAQPLGNWQEAFYQMLGLGFEPGNWLANMVHGAVYFVPIWLTVLTVGGIWEPLFAQLRGHPVTEGFLVTSTLIPLIVPPTLPLWQVAVATSFGVVVGKEVFGGVGMNVLNVALMTRAFLFFAYPAEISGEEPWIAVDGAGVDGFSGATWLAVAAEEGVAGLQGLSWWDAFMGKIPGSMGETSTLACLLGAGILVISRIGSWRTMLGLLIGTYGMTLALNAIGSDTNPMFDLPFHWHLVLGGWAFGAVFMATDPVTSPFLEKSKLIYGMLIGVLVILVRVINPAYPEGMMLAILFMNMFAPLVDHFFVQANIKRRLARHAV